MQEQVVLRNPVLTNFCVGRTQLLLVLQVFNFGEEFTEQLELFHIFNVLVTLLEAPLVIHDVAGP